MSTRQSETLRDPEIQVHYTKDKEEDSGADLVVEAAVVLAHCRGEGQHREEHHGRIHTEEPAEQKGRLDSENPGAYSKLVFERCCFSPANGGQRRAPSLGRHVATC